MEVCHQFLSGKGIKISGEWISACIDFIKSEEMNGQNSRNINWLKEKVYEQWLHSNLDEIGSSSLPTNISNSNCKIIEGKFAVQVNEVKDVGLPAYSQLQKIRKSNTENSSVTAEKTHVAAWEPKASRMLWLEITDGSCKCHCMEYRTIPLLSLTIKPGCKIMLSGKIECRRGVLLLMREHVTVLGGEVDTLLVPKAPENVLCQILGLPATEAPTEINEQSLLSSTINSTQSQYYPTQSTQGKNSNLKATQNMGRPTTIQEFFAKKTTNPNNFSRPTAKKGASDDFDDDFLDTDMEMAIAQAENKVIHSTSSTNLNSKNKKPIQNSIIDSTTSSSIRNSSNIKSTSLQSDEFPDEFDNDFGFNEDDMEMAMEMEVPEIVMEFDKFGRPISSKPENKKVKAVPQDKPSFDASTSHSFSVKSQNCSMISQKSSDFVPNFSIEDDFDDDFDLPAEDAFEKEFDKDDFIQNVQSNPPFTYLCLVKMKPPALIRYSIKGFILTLMSRLTRNENGWTLTAKIGDGTKACCVDIHNDVLEKLIGLSVQEMDEQRLKSKSDPSIKALRMQRLVDCQKKLIAVSCIFILEIDPSRERPILVEFKDILNIHADQLIKRKV